MAPRGRKPKPAHLRLVDGTHRTARHGSAAVAEKAVEQAVKAFGRPVMPKSLKGPAKAAWIRWIEPAFWLDATREPSAIAFCMLWGDLMTSPSSFSASLHSQLRAYQSVLGLTLEANRLHDRKNTKEAADLDDEGFA